LELLELNPNVVYGFTSGKWRQKATSIREQMRQIATSSLPPFVTFCRSGFALDFSSSQSLEDGVLDKLPADNGKTNARYLHCADVRGFLHQL